MRISARQDRGSAICVGNNDRCNEHVNLSADRYSDNVWAIFNHIYDVVTGVSISQKVFCGGGGCCCPDCPDQTGSCPGNISCCASDSTGHPGPTYGPSRTYVVGHVFHHILPFLPPCTTPTTIPPLTEPPFCGSLFCQEPYCDPVPPCDILPCCDPSLCIEPGAFGQAVVVGHQSDVRVVNNTMYKCAQGVQILCTYTPNAPDPKDCPPGADTTHGEQGLRRNTEVAVINNVILDTPDYGSSDTHVRVCTGRSFANPGLPFTLTDGELGFGHNLHYGVNRLFQLPSSGNPPITTVGLLVADPLTNYGVGSEGDDTGVNGGPDDNPHLVGPGTLQFDLRTSSPVSPPFMFNGGVNDIVYNAFTVEFGRSISHDYDGHMHLEPTRPIGAFSD